MHRGICDCRVGTRAQQKLLLLWDEGLKSRDIFGTTTVADGAAEGGEKDKTMRLEECLDLFSIQERLSENDSWYDGCLIAFVASYASSPS